MDRLTSGVATVHVTGNAVTKHDVDSNGGTRFGSRATFTLLLWYSFVLSVDSQGMKISFSSGCCILGHNVFWICVYGSTTRPSICSRKEVHGK